MHSAPTARAAFLARKPPTGTNESWKPFLSPVISRCGIGEFFTLLLCKQWDPLANRGNGWRVCEDAVRLRSSSVCLSGGELSLGHRETVSSWWDFSPFTLPSLYGI